MYTKTASGVLVVKVNGRYFLCVYGYGMSLVDKEAIIESFGLKIVLNSVNPEKIKSIDIKNYETVVKNMRINNSKAGNIKDFSSDIERDILGGVVGEPEEFLYAKVIAGKDSIKFTSAVKLEEIYNICTKLHQLYESKRYKEHFPWIDRIKIVKEKEVLKSLNTKLITLVNERKFGEVWAAPPEIIDWDRLEGFKYTAKGDIKEDIILSVVLSDGEKIDCSILKRKKVYYQLSSGYGSHWSLYKCLYCEIRDKNKAFLLTAGNWYEIDKNYSDNIEADIMTLSLYKGNFDFGEYDEIEEKIYNEKIARKNGTKAINLDRDLVYFNGAQVEICDIFYDKRELIHVKRYRGSSPLSHLFFQGLNAGFLLMTEKDFYNIAQRKMKVTAGHFDPGKHEIVYAIAAASKKDIRQMLPLFSKISLLHVAKQIRAYNFNLSIYKIPLNVDAIRKLEETKKKKNRVKKIKK